MKTIVVLTLAILFGVYAFDAKSVEKLISEKEFDKAEKILEAEKTKNKKNGEAYFYLGKLHLEKKDPEAAVNFFEKAAELEPDSANYYYMTAVAATDAIPHVNFMRKGAFSSTAMDNLKKTIELDPYHVAAISHLAFFYKKAPAIAGGSNSKASETLEKLKPFAKETYYSILIDFQLIDEEYEEAVKTIETMVAEYPKSDAGYYKGGMVYQNMKNYDKAFSFFKKALELNDDNDAALYQIGRTAVFSKKGLDEGKSALEKFVAKNEVSKGAPSKDGAYWRLGMIYELENNKTKALECFEKAYAIKESDSYKEAIERVK